MSKIAVDIGHNCAFDGGAVGIGNENVMVMDVGKRLIPKLEALGNSVLLVTPNTAINTNDALAQRVNKANAWGADLYVSIHANSGGGVGTEVWIGSESSRAVANNVLSNIVALGFKNRGVKVQGIEGHHLYVLNNTKMPSLLIECCFVDSQSDMDKFNAEATANAICKGITGKSLSIKKGWIQDNLKWYCYENNLPVKNQWRKDSKDWCYLTGDGSMAINEWHQDSSTKWFFCGSDGRIVHNKWQMDSKDWCYLGSDGTMITNVWQKDSSGKEFYCGSDGRILRNTTINGFKINDKGERI